MTELKTEGGGMVYIADDVLATIAGVAALEAEGVTGLAGNFSNAIGSRAVRKHISKGINVSVTGKKVNLALSITTKMGAKLHEVSAEVQQRVKTAIETMTGLDVAEVNIRVGAVAAEPSQA